MEAMELGSNDGDASFLDRTNQWDPQEEATWEANDDVEWQATWKR